MSKGKCFKMNPPYYLKNINKKNINHNYDFICFQKCSKWFLNIKSKKQEFFSNDLIGGINEKDINFLNSRINIPKGLSNYFPIDIKANPKFALDNNENIPLKISFDLNDNINKGKTNDSFINLNGFSKTYFEIQLNGFLHENQKVKFFNENISFGVEGYDIKKSIHNKIHSIKLENLPNEEIFFFQNNVFNSKRCNFAIEFSISKKDFHEYVLSKTFSFLGKTIKITKLIVDYSLPLIIFSISNPIPISYQSFLQNIYNWNANNISYNNIAHYYYSNNCFNRGYTFTKSNIQIFLTYTTPLIYETDNLKIKDIFDSFIESSLFGINCCFSHNNKQIKLKYFPILGSLFIKKLVNDSSTISDGTTLDESLISNKSLNSEKIIFKDDIKEIYNKKNFVEQYRTILKNYSSIKELELSDIGNESYFSIIWTTEKSYSNEYSIEIETNKFLNNISFEIFYQIKSGINGKHNLGIIGIRELNIHGYEDDYISKYNFEIFWFSSIDTISFINNYTLFNQRHHLFMNNKNLFYAMKNKIKIFDQ